MGKFKKAIDKARESEASPTVPDTKPSATPAPPVSAPLLVPDAPMPSGKPADKTPAQRRGGKRSDPNYKQIGCYVPVDLYRRVKSRAALEDIDVSDVVADLLQDWIDS
ncbi:MAG: hypothetical protein WBA10_07990 [Elainellaceae cyanobacterium]